MSFAVYADSEAEVLNNKLDLGLSNLENYLKSTSKEVKENSWWSNSIIYNIKPLRKLFSWIDKVIYGDENSSEKPKLIAHTGDFIGKSIQGNAFIEASNLYKKLLGNNDLNDKLKDYKKNKFEKYIKLTNIPSEVIKYIYADILFDEKLTDKPFSGVYNKVFKELERIAEENNVDIAFVLGNNDLSYELFSKRFNNSDYKRLHLVEGKVKKINGIKVGGIGGSIEASTYLGAITGKASYNNVNKSFINKLKNESIDLLITHKAFGNKPYGANNYKIIKGSLPKKGNFKENEFKTALSDLIKSVKPKYIASGHWHDNALFISSSVGNYVNPGSRGVAVVNGENVDFKVKPVKLSYSKELLGNVEELSRSIYLLDSLKTPEGRKELVNSINEAINKNKELLNNDEIKALWSKKDELINNEDKLSELLNLVVSNLRK